MRAVIYTSYGNEKVLQHTTLPKPIPEKSELLIKIAATTVTTSDCMMRRGDTLLSRLILGLCKPKTRYQLLGTEFSGTVEAIGEEVKEFSIGDEVFAFRGFGTGCYAEFKCIKESDSICKKPKSVSLVDAASYVDGATTALYFLRNKANIKNGERVLVNGASGNVGLFAIQIAKYFNADVTAVCSAKNFAMIQSLGADHVIDYTKEDFTKSNKKYDIIFDTVSKSSYKKCKPLLYSKGIYLETILSPKAIWNTLFTKITGGKRSIFAMSLKKRDELGFVAELIEQQKLTSIVDKKFSLENIKDAHQYVESGKKRGNIVIEV